MSLPHREIACAILIDTSGRYLLQRRDDDPNILYPGKIGLFGGHREGNESFSECVVREVHEETGYLAAPARFEHLGSYAGRDIEASNATLAGEYYLLRDVPIEAVTVTEGSLLIAEPRSLSSLAKDFAPSVTMAFGLLRNKPVAL
jgi:8-oxo-dGTP diphosphatase